MAIRSQPIQFMTPVLESLQIFTFRAIESLSLPQLGRITLITGKNSIGKTTILDAVRIYANRGSISVINSILSDRNELINVSSEDGDVSKIVNYESLFHGRHTTDCSIGQMGEKSPLIVSIAEGENDDGDIERLLRIEDSNRVREYAIDTISKRERTLRKDARNASKVINCEFLHPWKPDQDKIAAYWDEVALTEDSRILIKALSLLSGDNVLGVAAVTIPFPRIFPRISFARVDRFRYSYPRRILKVKIEGESSPIPLERLGDGASRVAGVALALANTARGLLVIDEVENGIHYSVQEEFWKIVGQLAKEKNVQVIASTHSWSCIEGFVAASKRLDLNSVLFNLIRDGNAIHAVRYGGDELEVAVDDGLEVR